MEMETENSHPYRTLQAFIMMHLHHQFVLIISRISRLLFTPTCSKQIYPHIIPLHCTFQFFKLFVPYLRFALYPFMLSAEDFSSLLCWYPFNMHALFVLNSVGSANGITTSVVWVVESGLDRAFEDLVISLIISVSYLADLITSITWG